MKKYFDDFDFSDFWDDNSYSIKEYIEECPSDELIKSIEEELGYKLPASYIELMKIHNGGMTLKNCYPTNEPSGWAEDHIAIEGIMGIGREKTYSLCGDMSSQYMIDEWGYPNIGVCIADTPSGAHEMIMLDYRACGKTGEPQVIYVDEEDDYSIIVLAKDFETFIKGLVGEEEYEDDTSEEDKQDDLEKVRTGTFSPILIKAFEIVRPQLPDPETIIRKLAEQIVEEKGYFKLHADEPSYLMFDFQFWLYSSYNTAKSYQYYMNFPKVFDTSYDLPSYQLILSISIVEEPYTFETGGFCEGFIRDWWNNRLEVGYIVEKENGFRPSETMETELLEKLKSYN